MSSRIYKVSILFLSLLFLSVPAFAAPPIKIGALFSVTGPAAFLGEPERNTAQMVVEEINKAGGVKGRKLELVVYDTQGDPTKANQAATRLIKEDKVVAIIGPSTTGETLAVIPIVEKAQIPLISCAASIKITEPVKKWVFKTAQNDSLAVGQIYEHLKKRQISKIAILTVSDGYGASGREMLKAHAAQYNMQIISDETFGPKDTDITAQLTKIRGSQAQALICWGTNPGPAIVARNFKQLGIRIPLYMSHGVASKKFIELAGVASEGIILPASWVYVAKFLPAKDPQKKVLLAYINSYKKRYKIEGDHFGGHAWDAVIMLKGAFERGADTPAAVRNQLENIKSFAGIGGIFNYSASDHAGLTKNAFALVEIKKKNWALAK